MSNPVKWLGEEIGRVVSARNVENIDKASIDRVMDEMSTDVNVFHMRV